MGDRFNGSVYHIFLHLKKIPWLEPDCPDSGRLLTVDDIMSSPVKSLTLCPNAGDVADLLSSCSHNSFPVVDKDRRFVGMVQRAQLLVLLSRRVLHSTKDVSAESDDDYALHQAMTTYFLRHSVHSRGSVTGAAKIDSIGLTTAERSDYLSLSRFMDISPIAVQSTLSVEQVSFRGVMLLENDAVCVAGVSVLPHYGSQALGRYRCGQYGSWGYH